MKSMKKLVLAGLVLLASVMVLVGCEMEADGQVEVPKFTVKFDMNADDAVGKMSPQIFSQGIEQELSLNTFERETWRFTGWSEDKNASTPTYTDGEKITISEDTILYAVWLSNGTVAPVVFSSANGKEFYYGETIKVKLSTSTSGATIKYHFGDNEWQIYSDEIDIYDNTTITAYAIKDGLKDSGETTVTYSGSIAPVTFNPQNGKKIYYGETVNVKLSTITPEATIKYHLGDNEWQNYSGEITVSSTVSITAYATKNELLNSNETTATYTVRELTSISVTTKPTQTLYTVGEDFNSNGLVITANYNDNASRKVDNWETNFNAVITEKGLKKNITVSYTEGNITKTTTFTVDVIGEPTYKFTETPVKLSNHVSSHTPATGSWTYVKFGDWPRTLKDSSVVVGSTPYCTVGSFDYYAGSDGNYYVKRNSKYYRVEPIVWRVLTTSYGSSGTALLLAEDMIESGIMFYENSYEDRKINESSTTIDVYPNNYKYSTIRAWLNGKYEVYDTQSEVYEGKGFLQTAFTTAAQGLINTTTVDNSKESTCPASSPTQFLQNGENPYVCKDTEDKIFLLSEKEVTTSSYGFKEYNISDNARNHQATDYAKADYGSTRPAWMLRSPFLVAISLHVVNSGFATPEDNKALQVSQTLLSGIVPALTISSSSIK